MIENLPNSKKSHILKLNIYLIMKIKIEYQNTNIT